MDLFSFALSQVLLSQLPAENKDKPRYDNSLLHLQETNIITPEERKRIEALRENERKVYGAKKKPEWKLACAYSHCYNKLNRDDICKGGDTNLFTLLKGEKTVVRGTRTYSLLSSNDRQIEFARSAKEPANRQLNQIQYRLTKERISFNIRTMAVVKTIETSLYREDYLIDRKIYGHDSLVLYSGKCNLQSNPSLNSIVLPPCIGANTFCKDIR